MRSDLARFSFGVRQLKFFDCSCNQTEGLSQFSVYHTQGDSVMRVVRVVIGKLY